MRLALLSTDDREIRKRYGDEYPIIPTPQAALLQGLEKHHDLEVHLISCLQQPVNAPKKLADNIWYHALHVPKIGWMRTGYQGCIRAVRRKLREIQPDIVHGQGTERDCCISAIFSGFPNVITLHGNMRLVARLHHARPLTFLWCAALLEHFTIPRADGVVCITNYTREAVAALARKTWVLPNAVDSSFFEIRRLPSPSVQILCIATVDPRKNQNALIRAMDAFRPQGNFELVFLGEANRDNPYVREFFELLETRPWCHFGGFADRNTVRQYMASASGLVLPSLEDNCPMAVLEAMAAGVPVAAARVGGVPDLVRHGETGLLFDPLSGETMAVAMKQLLENREPSVAARAQSEARQRFHPEIIAARHLKIYREVLSSPRR